MPRDIGRAFLARMRDRQKSLFASPFEQRFELAGRVAELCRIEAVRDHAFLLRQCLLQGCHGGGLVEVPREAHDFEVMPSSVSTSPINSSDDSRKRDTGHVGLRIERDLHVEDTLSALSLDTSAWVIEVSPVAKKMRAR